VILGKFWSRFDLQQRRNRKLLGDDLGCLREQTVAGSYNEAADCFTVCRFTWLATSAGNTPWKTGAQCIAGVRLQTKERG
jgi:hypothetical protein